MVCKIAFNYIDNHINIIYKVVHKTNEKYINFMRGYTLTICK